MQYAKEVLHHPLSLLIAAFVLTTLGVGFRAYIRDLQSQQAKRTAMIQYLKGLKQARTNRPRVKTAAGIHSLRGQAYFW
jgi:hypothetical protein